MGCGASKNNKHTNTNIDRFKQMTPYERAQFIAHMKMYAR